MAIIAGESVDDDTGALNVLPVTSVPAGAFFLNGVAHNKAGVMYVILDEAVSNPHTTVNGEAVTEDGALYVTTTPPANGAYIAGVLHSEDGKRYVSNILFEPNPIAGISVNSNGAMLVYFNAPAEAFSIITESGDHLTTELGDRLITETQ